MFKSIVAALAIAATGLTISAASAQADYYTTHEFGNSTYTYGSNGSSFNTQSFGNSTYYNGTDQYGNSYSGSCSSIGNSTYCY
jgi:hypothetical protein